MASAIGIDLGGTKILGARMSGAAIEQVEKIDTPRAGGPGAVIDALVEVAGRLGGREVAAVGIGAPGPVRPGSGRAGPAPNLAGWDRAIDLAGPLTGALGVPVLVENDANAAVVAEHRLGAAVGRTDVVGVWVGTGVGGGLVLDGRLRRGRGMAGEIGHAVVEPGGRRCGCGGRGHLEAYAGRAAIEREARRRHGAGRRSALVELAGKKAMKSSAIAKALASGDKVATELLGEAVEALAVALAGVAVVVDVELAVLGGGLVDRLGPQFVERVERATSRLLFAGATLPAAPSALGDHAGALGAALLALEAAGVPSG